MPLSGSVLFVGFVFGRLLGQLKPANGRSLTTFSKELEVISRHTYFIIPNGSARSLIAMAS